MTEHYTADGIEEDAEGWFVPRCGCGWKWARCPNLETAVDVLMEHAYDQGTFDARAVASEKTVPAPSEGET